MSRALCLGADAKEGRGALYTSTMRGSCARAISGAVIQHRQKKRAAEKGGPQHRDPQGRCLRGDKEETGGGRGGGII